MRFVRLTRRERPCAHAYIVPATPTIRDLALKTSLNSMTNLHSSWRNITVLLSILSRTLFSFFPRWFTKKTLLLHRARDLEEGQTTTSLSHGNGSTWVIFVVRHTRTFEYGPTCYVKPLLVLCTCTHVDILFMTFALYLTKPNFTSITRSWVYFCMFGMYMHPSVWSVMPVQCILSCSGHLAF